MEAYSLFQVNEFIKRSIAINFPAPIWVQAEIGQIRQARGHWYLELVEKGERDDEIVARASAAIWANKYLQIKKKVGINLDAILAEGMEVMVKCQVSFHERYGMKFSVEDVQAEYTLGKLAQDRAATVAELRRLELLGGNAKVEAQPVLQRLAVISGATAAGYQDFVKQLKNNKYGYHFSIDFFPAAMQGPQLEPEILEGLSSIVEQGNFDAVIIIRGGGSRLDLMGFDSLLLSKAIAMFPIPVLTGIGHDIDETVIDLVAYKALKTPTAVADYIVHYNSHFEENLLEKIQFITAEAELYLQIEKDKLIRSEEFLKIKIPALLADAQYQLNHQRLFLAQQIPSRLREEAQRLAFKTKQLNPAAARILEMANLKLEKIKTQVELLSPEKILERGFSINLINGKAIGKNNLPKLGDQMTTITRVGEIASKIENYEQKK